ncbi:hypothetical protein ACSQ67_014169 [Phaseolus vulgaris]
MSTHHIPGLKKVPRVRLFADSSGTDGAGGKGELHHGRRRLHPSEISRWPVCALDGESDGMIRKTLKNNKEMMAALYESIVPWEESFAVDEKVVWVRCEHYLSACGTRGCFERVAAQVGSLVEVDGATPEFEDLEFVRLRVRAPVGPAIHMVTEMKINDILAELSWKKKFFRSTHVGIDCMARGVRHEETIRTRGRRRSSMRIISGSKDVEECSIKFSAEDAVGEGAAPVQSSSSKDAGSRAESRLPFLEDQVGCSWKVSADGAHSKHAPVRKEDGTSKRRGASARNTKSGVDDAVEAGASKSDNEKSDDNPTDGSNGSSSGVEASGEDVVGKEKTTEEDDGMGMYTPRTRRHERLCELSPTSPPTRVYHIRTGARAKAIETRCGER